MWAGIVVPAVTVHDCGLAARFVKENCQSIDGSAAVPTRCC